MRKLILPALLCGFALTMMPALGRALTCPAGDDNMLDWMTLDTATTQHLNGPQSLPLYTVLPASGLSGGSRVITAARAIPGMFSYNDSTNIYQWITDYDPYSYTDSPLLQSFR